MGAETGEIKDAESTAVSEGKYLDPKKFFDDFTERMKQEGFDFEINVLQNPKDKKYLALMFSLKGTVKALGSIWVDYNAERKTLTIYSIGGKNRTDPDDEWKPNGIGAGLVAYVLTKYKDTEMIDGKIRNTNLRVYERAIQEGLSEEEAIKQTPAYKLRAKFGYDVLESHQWNKDHNVCTIVTRKARVV